MKGVLHICLHIEQHIVIKIGSKVPHSGAGDQGHAIQRKHLARKHVSMFFRANLSFITIKKTELSALNAALGSSGTSTETSTMLDTKRILLLSFTSAVSVQ